VSVQTAHRTLMTLSSVVNYINVKLTNFLYERRVLAAFSSYMYVKKRRLYEKIVRKMLMKLTAGHIFNRLHHF